MKSKLWVIVALAMIASMLFGCAAQPTAAPAAPVAPAAAPAAAEPTAVPAAPAAAAGEKIKVGLSFSDFATERWKGEQVLMEKLLKDKGYDVVWQEANHDVKLQNDQIDNMVTQGAKALIVIAEDGDAAATAVDKAVAAGVKVIAYDRLIKSTGISAYISFNNTEVGRNQAEGVVKALQMDSGKWTKDNPVKLMLMGGSPTDNNAILVRQGQEEVLKPYIDQGLIKVVADQWVDNWDPANALKIMENVLTAQQNKIDAVVASNDGTALGALTALKAQTPPTSKKTMPAITYCRVLRSMVVSEAASGRIERLQRSAAGSCTAQTQSGGTRLRRGAPARILSVQSCNLCPHLAQCLSSGAASAPQLEQKPGWVPAGISISISSPTTVSSSTLPPSIASTTGTRTVQCRSSPSRTNTGWGRSLTSMYRSPAGPPPGPTSP